MRIVFNYTSWIRHARSDAATQCSDTGDLPITSYHKRALIHVQAGEGGAERGGWDLLTQAPKIWSLLRAPLGPQNEFFLCMVTAGGSAPGGVLVRPILGFPYGEGVKPSSVNINLPAWNRAAHVRPEDWAKLWGVEVSSPVLSPSQPVLVRAHPSVWDGLVTL